MKPQIPRTIASIIAEAESKKTAKAQAEVLLAHKSSVLKAVVGHGMDPKVKWLLPETDPPYRPLPKAADQETSLATQIRMLEYLVEGSGNNVNQRKREEIFVRLLENVDPDDAILLLRMKNKKLQLKVEAVKIAFPGISGEW
jgi:hypothetical protein